MAGDQFSQSNPLSLPDGHEIPLSDRNICSSHATQLLAFRQSLLRQAQDLPLLGKGPSSLPTIQGCEHLLATLRQASVHTAKDTKTE